MMNETNATGDGGRMVGVSRYQQVLTMIGALGICEFIFLVLAFFINLWFLISIITSRELRGKMRNQIICGMSFLHAFMAAILSTVETYQYLMIKNRQRFPPHFRCQGRAYVVTMRLIESVTEDFMLATLTLVFLAQVLEFRPALRLKPLFLRTGHAALLLSPWLLALIAAPFSLALTTFNGYPCLDGYWRKRVLFDIIYTAVPIAASAVIVIVAGAIWYKKYHTRNSLDQGKMRAQLVGNEPEIDNPTAYIVTVGGALLCEVLKLIITFWRPLPAGFRARLILGGTALAISSLRSVVLPFVWLLFSDVRTRLKTWRPWRCSGSGSLGDFVVNYNKEVETA